MRDPKRALEIELDVSICMNVLTRSRRGRVAGKVIYTISG